MGRVVVGGQIIPAVTGGVFNFVSAGSSTPAVLPWPQGRPETYDPDKVWDEDTETWIDNDARGGGRLKNQILAISDQGVVYFGGI